MERPYVATSPESAAINQRIIELRGDGIRHGGKTYMEIAEILYQEGYRGKRGDRLTNTAIRHRYDHITTKGAVTEDSPPEEAPTTKTCLGGCRPPELEICLSAAGQ